MAVLEFTNDNFQAEVVDSDGYVLVDFWAEWCGPCKMLAPVIESVSEHFEEKLKVGKLDTDKNPDLAQKYQITGIPCNILYFKGEEVARIVGYKGEESFVESIEPFLK